MLGQPVPLGALFSYSTRSRREVAFDARLRSETEAAIRGVRSLIEDQRMPSAPNDARYPNCSLINACIPWVAGEPDRVRGLQVPHTGPRRSDRRMNS